MENISFKQQPYTKDMKHINDTIITKKLLAFTHFCLIVTMAAIKNLIATGGPDSTSSPVVLASTNEA